MYSSQIWAIFMRSCGMPQVGVLCLIIPRRPRRNSSDHSYSHHLPPPPNFLQNDSNQQHVESIYFERSVSLVIKDSPPLTVYYYSVSTVDQIEWPKKLFRNKLPNLYVEVRLEQSVQCTRVIDRSMTPNWNEELPL
jgi:hypothetical protein